MKLFDNTLTVLERALDVRLYRQNLLASNAANLDTPGYTQREVDFSEAMRLAAEQPEFGSESAARTATVEVAGTAGMDGNTVDLDRTMVALAENGLQYGASARAAGKKLAILRAVATEGTG